ncbi:type VI secretion system Vgr family protein [Vibrio sp. SCSIO 43137]|uniref:type VI secretion system Vgr family protein n=1 Tax=Vibrio sp. SCSIO 43137 TaxID=3021011 RepID=UPI0023078C6A|nr:type VI secretion system tip protein TssI/VgrG [Vibrio sp. SCSIO 43137]WCE31037.1 type VI secretion system tip protein TssI/VgrG [Vibrio sp. SCSIO 43137]
MASGEYNSGSRPLTTKLNGKGPYITTDLTCKEQLSAGCKISLSLVAPEPIDESALGKAVSIEFTFQQESRFYNGLVTSIELIEYSIEKDLYYYRIGSSDAFSLLAFRHNRQIFQQMTSKQVIEQIFGDAGIKSYTDFSVSGDGEEHEYCTQMDETDLAFVQRVMATEGWHYRVDHSSSSHKVQLSDSNQNFESAENSPYSYKKTGSSDYNLANWKQKSKVTTAKISLADYSQELPELIDSGEQASSLSNSLSELSDYYYGQGSKDKSVIRDLAKTRMEAYDSAKIICSASSTIMALSAGKKFKLTEHPISASNQEYLVTEIVHHIKCSESGRELQYRNQFECIPSSTPFRPKHLGKPKVSCVHSATVTGPSGEEIYSDALGRVKVQFHWDANGKNDENTSCWLPVSQNFASKGFGVQFTPRIGDEVLVSYIDGDPDYPVVSGSIYNPTNTPPFESATQSGVRTRATPDGSSKTSNEIRFDDQKDKEEFYIHAQKDMLTEVENDATSTITGIKTVSVEKSLDISSKEEFSAATEKSMSVSSKEAFSLSSDKTADMSSKEDFSVKSDKNVAIEASSNADLKATASITVDGQEISLKGKTKIALAVGACKIELSASGIKIEAPQVSIAGQAKAELKAAMVTVEGQGKADLKGALVSVNGSAMTQIKAGAMVEIQGAIAKVN